MPNKQTNCNCCQPINKEGLREEGFENSKGEKGEFHCPKCGRLINKCFSQTGFPLLLSNLNNGTKVYTVKIL